MSFIKSIISRYLRAPRFAKLLVIFLVLGLGWYAIRSVRSQGSTNPQYQTDTATKGTLISSVTASGTISSSNYANINTALSGSITKVYVKNGDTVKQGQKIADIEPDTDSKQRQAAAWASYLNAKSAVKNAETNKLTLQTQLENTRVSVLKAQMDVDALNKNLSESKNNPETQQPYSDMEKQVINSALTTARWSFTANEQKYNEADSAIAQAKASLNSAWLNYSQLSSTITAPASGTLANFSLASGVAINTPASSNSNTTSTTKIGTIIKSQTALQATIALTEIDVTKVKADQKVTMTLDAFPDKTFTGRVLSLDTTGSVSSGVTTYPATLVFDAPLENMYPNMAVNATIITNIKDNVLMVPSAAVQSQNGETFVRVMKNGNPEPVAVVVGDAGDSRTEIVSGLNEGDTVVTSIIMPSTSGSNSTGTSPFGSFGGRGGGQQIRMVVPR